MKTVIISLGLLLATQTLLIVADTNEEEGCGCIQIFEPVCAGNKQYGNKCEAQCANAEIDCERACPCDAETDHCVCCRPSRERKPLFCTRLRVDCSKCEGTLGFDKNNN